MDNQQASSNLIPLPGLSHYYTDGVGNIYSTKRGDTKKLKTRLHYGRSASPYIRVKAAAKNYLLHRLVASVHLKRPLAKEERVNHKDGDTVNNSLNNLEVLSHRENVAHAVRNNLYCSGKEWYKAREASTTIPRGSTLK